MCLSFSFHMFLVNYFLLLLPQGSGFKWRSLSQSPEQHRYVALFLSCQENPVGSANSVLAAVLRPDRHVALAILFF